MENGKTWQNGGERNLRLRRGNSETLVKNHILGILRGQKRAPQNDKGLRDSSNGSASELAIAEGDRFFPKIPTVAA